MTDFEDRAYAILEELCNEYVFYWSAYGPAWFRQRDTVATHLAQAEWAAYRDFLLEADFIYFDEKSAVWRPTGSGERFIYGTERYAENTERLATLCASPREPNRDVDHTLYREVD